MESSPDRAPALDGNARKPRRSRRPASPKQPRSTPPAVREPQASESPGVGRTTTQQQLVERLRKHLLPALRADLRGIAARTGIPIETLRKRRDDLASEKRCLPGFDSMVVIARACGWSLDRLIDPECDDPRPGPPRADAPLAVQDAVHAHFVQVARRAVPYLRPHDIAIVVPDPINILWQVEEQFAERIQNAVAFLDSQRRAELENAWEDVMRVFRTRDIAERLTDGDVALLPWGDVIAVRVRESVGQGQWHVAERRFVMPQVPVRRHDAWLIVRGLTTAVRKIADLALRGVCDRLEVDYGFTDEEIAAARGRLTRPVGRGAGLRACELGEVFEAFAQFRDGRRYPTDVLRSLLAIDRSANSGDRAPIHDMATLNALFGAFCKAVGLVWYPDEARFVLDAAGYGFLNGILLPGLTDARLRIVRPTPGAANVLK